MSSPPSRAGTLTAVFLLVVGVLGVLAAWWLLAHPLARGGAPVAVRPITPERHAEGAPLLLAWEGGGPPFHVVLKRLGGESVWRSSRLSAPMVEVPEEIRRAMRAGDEYEWSVEAVDRRGRPFSSGAFRLTVIPDREPQRL